MTSPAAKMCGTVVRNVVVDLERPRSSAGRPAALEVQPLGRATRPAENSAMSATMRLPDSSRQHGPRRRAFDRPRSSPPLSPKRKVTLRLRIWWSSSSTISRSRNSSGRSRRSITVTCDAERGEHRGVLDADHAGADDRQRARQPLQLLMSSLVMIDSPSAATPAAGPGACRLAIGRCGRDHRTAAVADDCEAVRIDERRFAARARRRRCAAAGSR